MLAFRFDVRCIPRISSPHSQPCTARTCTRSSSCTLRPARVASCSNHFHQSLSDLQDDFARAWEDSLCLPFASLSTGSFLFDLPCPKLFRFEHFSTCQGSATCPHLSLLNATCPSSTTNLHPCLLNGFLLSACIQIRYIDL